MEPSIVWHKTAAGAESFVVRDEDGAVVASAGAVLPRDGRRADIEWAPNPVVGRMSRAAARLLAHGLDRVEGNARLLDEAFFEA